jgi:hypothetical protein
MKAGRAVLAVIAVAAVSLIAVQVAHLQPQFPIARSLKLLGGYASIKLELGNQLRAKYS